MWDSGVFEILGNFGINERKISMIAMPSKIPTLPPLALLPCVPTAPELSSWSLTRRGSSLCGRAGPVPDPQQTLEDAPKLR
ncbi:MAG: hypothetical protein A3K19_24535 [Lentisphaerae bacterium RIFOXYB12_FULL_65_16]|nr:MAG: hypothetical protein A3K19_24535 [Lentisphaerae bacterium RIFOXYB12_FULL_65_16]